MIPKDKAEKVFYSGLNGFTEDFMEDGRNQPAAQERESF